MGWKFEPVDRYPPQQWLRRAVVFTAVVAIFVLQAAVISEVYVVVAALVLPYAVAAWIQTGRSRRMERQRPERGEGLLPRQPEPGPASMVLPGRDLALVTKSGAAVMGAGSLLASLYAASQGETSPAVGVLLLGCSVIYLAFVPPQYQDLFIRPGANGGPVPRPLSRAAAETIRSGEIPADPVIRGEAVRQAQLKLALARNFSVALAVFLSGMAVLTLGTPPSDLVPLLIPAAVFGFAIGGTAVWRYRAKRFLNLT